jgi:hypothetical protein
MKKPGFGLKIGAVLNAILLVVGFIGCQAGAFNSPADKNEVPSSTKQAEWTPLPAQESPAAGAKPESVFMSSTKSPFPSSLQGIVSGLTPAGTAQPAPPVPQKGGANPQ